MMDRFLQVDRNAYLLGLLRLVAERIGLNSFEFDCADQLHTRIKGENALIAEKWDSFESAYSSWAREVEALHRTVRSMGGNEARARQAEKVTREAREKAKEALIKALPK